MKFRIINIAPLFVEHQQEIVADLLALQKNCGVTDVAFILPLNPEGKIPSLAKANGLCDRFLSLREALHGSSLRIGILMQSTLGHGNYSAMPFQRIVRADGTTNNRPCPLDVDFQNHFRDVVKTIVATRPEFLLVDDDFRMFLCDYGCFCPLHLAELNRRAGTAFDRESLMAVLQKTDSASRRIGDLWNQVLEQGMLDLAALIRREIDQVDPALPCGLCAAMDGPGRIAGIAPLARALAGENPLLVRLNNSFYLDNDPRGLMQRLLPTAAQAEALAGIPVILSESDSYPHNRYCTSSRALNAQIVFSELYGTTGAKLWITRIDDYDPTAGSAYREMLHANHRLYQTLMETVAAVTWDEPAGSLPRQPVSPWHPAQYWKDRPPTWAANVCAMMGIPVRMTASPDARVIMLTGPESELLSDAEIKEFLAKGLLLDGSAAEALGRRGFGEFLGVDAHLFAGEDDTTVEYFNDDPLNGNSRNVRLSAKAYFSGNNRRLTIRGRAVRTLSNAVCVPYYMSPEKQDRGPAVTLFENRLGGRVAVYAVTLDPSSYFLIYFSNLLSSARREQLLNILTWLNRKPLPLIVESDVNVYVRHGMIAPAQGGGELLAAFNLNIDPLPSLRLKTDGNPLARIEQLSGSGRWRQLKWTAESGTLVKVRTKLETLVPVILRIHRQ